MFNHAKKETGIKRWGKALAAVLVCALALITVSACGSVPEEPVSNEPGTEVIDVLDLTALSMTVRSAEITNLQTKPHEYTGRYIRINGVYNATFSEILGRDRHMILMAADSCCPDVAMEFIKGGDFASPDEYADYPAFDTPVTILGQFNTYKHEDTGIMYQHLTVREIDW